MICRSGIKCKVVPVTFTEKEVTKNPLIRNTCLGLAFFMSPDRLNWIFFSWFEEMYCPMKKGLKNRLNAEIFKNRKCGDEGEKADHFKF